MRLFSRTEATIKEITEGEIVGVDDTSNPELTF
jgi:hypothetical protein